MKREVNLEVVRRIVFIIGIVTLSALVIPMVLYVFGVMTKKTMTIIYIVPVLLMTWMTIYLKRHHLV